MVGNGLKEQRKMRGITQVELAKETGIPQSTLSAWEKGINIPNIADCIKLADFYGISLDELVGRNI
ncbi:MAG: helix-turn-helix transcriptional regulator [Clostridia bacterium]|nr:helix-turn-helix transcriptional regulator [Clostridia bacterium]